MSSRDSVGGGPYKVEEAFDLYDPMDAYSFDSSDWQPAKSMW